MNVTLNNQLVEAVKFFEEDYKRFISQIENLEKEIARLREGTVVWPPHPTRPNKIAEKQLLSVVLLLLFVWPVGIPYSIYFAFTKKKREKQNNEKYIAEMVKYEEQKNQIKDSIEADKRKIIELTNRISNIKAQQQLFYQNKGGCLAFLPKYARSYGVVIDLYKIIHEEYKFTLAGALKLQEKWESDRIELQEKIEENELKEAAEKREEQRHQELLKKYDELAYQQKMAADAQNQTNEQLEKIHQDNLRRYY